MFRISLILFVACVTAVKAADQSVARRWNERALDAIRVDTPHPPAQARNLFSLSVAMYDAWAAYDGTAVGYIYRGKHTAADIEAVRRKAISYAAYRILKERHVYSRTAAATLAADDALMVALGYDTNNISRDVATPAGLGNAIFDAVSAWFIDDGSRQTAGTPYPFANPPIAYPDYPVGQGGYVYVNPPLAVSVPGINDGRGNTVVDINIWQRLQIVNSVDQNGFPQGPVQPYLGAQWLGVRPFSLTRPDPSSLWFDPGPPPYFGGATHAGFVNEAVAVITAASHLDPDDGVMIDISPGTRGNNSLEFAGNYGDGSFGIYDGLGHASNPATSQPYEPNLVKRGDYGRIVAEFWADGPNSETPPGHWNTLANDLADHPLLVKKIGGTGPVVDDLEWDVKMYFGLNASVHDAACAAWGVKRYYNAYRPIGIIRYLAGFGQSSNPGLASYNPYGLPLIPEIIELVTPTSVISGRHPGLTPGKIAVRAWPGPPADPANNFSGVRWIHGDKWSTYQRTNFVAPAFPGYVSGHSAFSRAAAEVLTGLTGSPFFPGGLGTYDGFTLGFEKGPSQPVPLQWATYYDASDEAGISRIWGGIHPPIDNLSGRRVGAKVGQAVWNLAQKYFDGTVIQTPVELAVRQLPDGRHEVRIETLRGLYYKLESATDLNTGFDDDRAGLELTKETSIARTNSAAGPAMYYRAAASTTP
jgi:hypothetical protein